jgi:UDP-N-acetylmuramoylalanine--D-glutamate ligase
MEGALPASGAWNGGRWPLDLLGIPVRVSPGRPARAAVLGLARSGLGAARLLQSRGTPVDLLDLKRPEEERESIERLVSAGAKLRIGPHDPAWLSSYDLIVKSPGVPGGIPFLRAAADLGVPVLGELELAFLAARGPVVAITGTNGKSTTTAWTGDMFRLAGRRSLVVGNIGRAMSDGVLEDPEAVFVCEVSSFQLEDVRTFRPRVGVLLNVTPDHLDRHGSLASYLETKLRLFDRQRADDLAIFGPDPRLLRSAEGRGQARRARFAIEDPGEEGAFVRDGVIRLRREGRETAVLPAARLALPGPHNLENALAAAAAAAELGVEVEAIARSLESFGGLPHRLEPVGTVDGIRFVNDSKATNVDSLSVALDAFPEPVVLIAGGRHKDQDFRPLAAKVRRQVSHLVLIGEASGRLEEAWTGVPVERAESLEAAVAAARRRARPGQVVLLSPACSSFDMFRNYEDRGDRFRTAVRLLKEEA